MAEFLGDVRPDFWVSDRFGAQMGWAKTDNRSWLLIYIRDAQYAIDAGDTAFAPGLRKLLKRACAIGHRRPTLADATLRTYNYQLDSKLDALLRLTPKHDEGKKLQDVIKGCRRYMFVFLNRAIPPTNNGSEQALRPCVVYRKVTNCFRSEMGGPPLRRYSIRHRNRAPQSHRRAGRHPLNSERSAARQNRAVSTATPHPTGEQLLHFLLGKIYKRARR